MSTLKICVVDYGVGNIGSITNLLKSLGHIAIVSSNSSEMDKADVIILPGVGSAVEAIGRLQEMSIRNSILHQCGLKKPLIGLCLGGQLLFDFLDESNCSGLQIIKGNVKSIDSVGSVNTGWRRLNWEHLTKLGITKALKEKDTYFFNHEYRMIPDNAEVSVCTSAGSDVAAIVKQGNTWAIQFHPEKSQEPGRILMRNILSHGN